MDDFTYEANHHLLNTILLASNALKTANLNLSLRRRTREYLFHAENSLDDAIATLRDMMDYEFNQDPGYRRWGMKEGWQAPETDEELAWYEENIGEWDEVESDLADRNPGRRQITMSGGEFIHEG